MAEEVTRWPVTEENRVKHQACPIGNCSRKRGTERGFSTNNSLSPVSIKASIIHTHSFIYHPRCKMFSSSISVSPVSIIPPMLHTYSFIYHPRCKMFFSQHFSFPCQYHSTNAPHSFIHLPPTLYNVFLPALQFPLSVSFHQRSILIHPSTTHAV